MVRPTVAMSRCGLRVYGQNDSRIRGDSPIRRMRRMHGVGEIRRSSRIGRRQATSTWPSTSRTMRSAWSAIARSCVTMTIVRFCWRFKVRRMRDDFLAGVLVEIAGRLVGQQHARAGRPAPGRWPPAAFRRRRARAAGASAGAPGRPVSSSSSAWLRRARGGGADSSKTPSAIISGDEHVFQRRQLRQQVIELKDHAEVAGCAARRGAAAGRLSMRRPSKVDLALVGRVERAQQVQQRALAASRSGRRSPETRRWRTSRSTPRSTGISTRPLR